MSDPNPPTTPGDPPIIIQGGSVNIIVPPNFVEQTTAAQATNSGNGKDFKNGKVSLISLQIDDNTPIPLKTDAKITITYK